jgi:hypothetical protein
VAFNEFDLQRIEHVVGGFCRVAVLRGEELHDRPHEPHRGIGQGGNGGLDTLGEAPRRLVVHRALPRPEDRRPNAGQEFQRTLFGRR